MANDKKNRSKKQNKKEAPLSKNELAEKKILHTEVAVLGMLLAAVLLIIGWFAPDAVVIKWVSDGFKYLFGGGMLALPFVLVAISMYLLVFLKKKKRVGKIVALSVLPPLFGMVAHVFTAPRYSSFSALCADALDYGSGGIISGGLTELMMRGISRVGSAIVICLVSVLTVAWLFGITISKICEKAGERLEKRSVKVREKAADRRSARARERELAEQRRAEAEQRRREEQERREARLNDPKRSTQPINKDNMDIPLDDVRPAPQGTFGSSFVKPIAVEIPASPEPEEYLQEDAYTPAEEDDVFTEVLPPEPRKDEKEPEGMSADDIEQEIAQLTAANPAPPDYIFPPMELLSPIGDGGSGDIEAEIHANAEKLISTLSSFGVEAKIVNVTHGPTVTRYEVQMNSGIKFSKLAALSDDLAIALAAQSVRIARIPDESAVGIEVPNRAVSTVRIREVIASKEFADSKSKVTFALGKDIAGRPVVGDIARLPHMLVAGTTGSGKSVCINTLLISMLYKARPDELKLIMVDPKMVELNSYNGIPHLMIPVVTDPKKAAGALQWAVMEMMSRYKRFNESGVRNFIDYNAEAERREKTYDYSIPFEEAEADRPPRLEKLPRIVIVVDELADLMLTSPGEVEDAICRIAQMARAAGMHLIIATQRPSADVITGLMKANIPSRIAFAVASQLESRIILDQMGAEKLLGKGDMLFNPLGANKPIRIQGCFISDDEIEGVVNFIKNNSTPSYSDDVIEQINKNAENVDKKGSKGAKSAVSDSGDGEDDELDELFYDAVDIVFEAGQVSVSMLQRRLKLGYNRAGRLVDQMEERGIVGPFEGSKPRALLLSKEDWKEMKFRRENQE